jgi:hypothetical protein
MSTTVLDGVDLSGRSVEICSETGEILMTVSYRDAITLQG